MKKLWIAKIAVIFIAGIICAHGQTPHVLYNFGIHPGDPMNPSGSIAQGRNGSLYANTSSATFSVSPSGRLTILSAAGGGAGGVTLGTDGSLYGASTDGGENAYGYIYKVDPSGNAGILYSFTGDNNFYGDAAPLAPPIQGIDGNWYGTACGTDCLFYGGTGGEVYMLTPSGTLNQLHAFTLFEGVDPSAALVQATNGNFYGTAIVGGKMFDDLGKGSVFEISPPGKFRVVFLFSFDATLGAHPRVAMIEGADGSLYGTTSYGGSGGISGGGVLFRITQGAFQVLHDFTGGSDGSDPQGLLQATDGNIYGMTSANCGTIFRLSPAGQFDTIYTFPGDGSLGCNPISTLIQHTNGLLYGTTSNIGMANGGTFFSLDLSAAPFVTFLPSARQIGHTLEILGQGFTGASAVTFNGTPATTFKVFSNTYLTATVPAGATTGLVQVTTPSGTLTSNKQFQVKPTITGFTPASGAPGTQVRIAGSGLTQTSKITFGTTVATDFTVNADTQVSVTVPAGASTTKIGITTTGAPSYSDNVFTVAQ